MVRLVSPAQEFTRDQCSGRLAPLHEQSLTNFASQAEPHRPRRRQAHSKPKQTLTQGEGLIEGFESPRFIFFTRTRSFREDPVANRGFQYMAIHWQDCCGKKSYFKKLGKKCSAGHVFLFAAKLNSSSQCVSTTQT